MKINEVRALGKSMGINSFGKNKVELIKEIQREQGNFDCFGTAKDYCDPLECLFRASCFSD